MQSDQIYEQLNYVLSCIRVRQNNFILLMEKLQSGQTHEINYFLQEDQNHMTKIHSTLNKYQTTGDGTSSQLVNRFWAKMLKLMKVSLERLKLLSLLDQRLWDAYTEIIALLNSCLGNSDLRMMKHLQGILKRRMMSALKVTERRQPILTEWKGSVEVKKAEPEKSHKGQLQRSQPCKVKPKEFIKKRSQQSIQRRFRQSDYKRFLQSREHLEDICYQSFEGRADLQFLDKKKSREQNAMTLYDQLFLRNIPNHKVITKYLFQSKKKQDQKQEAMRQAITLNVNRPTKTLLDARRNLAEKSARKLADKKVKKMDNLNVEIQKMLFSSSRLKRDQKVRPKTAKLEKEEPPESRKRCRKMIRKTAKA